MALGLQDDATVLIENNLSGVGVELLRTDVTNGAPRLDIRCVNLNVLTLRIGTLFSGMDTCSDQQFPGGFRFSAPR